MSLVSLRKLEQSAEREPRRPIAKRKVNADSFIENAIAYANGARGFDNVVPLDTGMQPVPSKPLKRATFTLGDVAINQLSKMSYTTGLSRSAILRQLIARHAHDTDI